MEVLPIVCEDSGELTGVCLPRHEALAKEAWCQTTNVFVMNSQGQILCHQRSLNKERLPGVWMTHLGGHVGEGESYEENAVKELSEEAGISAEPRELVAWRTTKVQKARIWVREYVVHKDVGAESLVPQPGEVEKFAWMSVDEILSSFRAQPEMWCAGTHDFYVEYHCLRAVLTAAQHVGIVQTAHPIHRWQPLPQV